jgi:uncharacterized membrane protein YcaP (DUF421 family)
VLASILSDLGASGSDLAVGAVAAIGVYLAVVVATRISGLRSFSKMSAFDFAMTVAIGSLIATAASGQAPLATVVVGVATLFVAQFTVAILRRRSLLHGVVDNSPLLLMEDGRVLHDNLASARVTIDDLHGKLREANVHAYASVRAVVLETTGDLSVLHGEVPLQAELLQGVRREPRGRTG